MAMHHFRPRECPDCDCNGVNDREPGWCSTCDGEGCILAVCGECYGALADGDHLRDSRGYGTDSTDEFDTLAEATLLDDGTTHVEIVQIDKREQQRDS